MSNKGNENVIVDNEDPDIPKTITDCTCRNDPFASLPPELIPKQKTWKSKFRKVTCPGCGLIYWTNRNTDLCYECEK